MKILLAAALSVAALGLPATAMAAENQVCPPGMNAGTCLDNAYRAIDELRARVRALEERVNGAPAPMVSEPAPAPRVETEEDRMSRAATRPRAPSTPDKNGCMGGQIFINEECHCPITQPFWDGEVCRGP